MSTRTSRHELPTTVDRLRSSRRSALRLGAETLASGLAIACGGRAVRAAETPSRLRVFCGSPPGGIPDLIARRYADALAARYPAGVVVENRPGAGGLLAINQLLHGHVASDEATLLLAHGGIATMYPALYVKLPYDPATQLAPLSLAAETAFGLAAGPAVPPAVQTVPALLEQMRLDPALAQYGSPGPGTMPHVLGAMLTHAARIAATHVPYAGGPALLVDLMGGRLACGFLPEGLLRQPHAGGRLRVLASTAARGNGFMTELPTFADQGRPALMVTEWFAFFMAASTAAPTLMQVSAAVRAAAAAPALTASLRDLAMHASTSTPDALAERIANERGPWQAAIQTAGIRLQQ